MQLGVPSRTALAAAAHRAAHQVLEQGRIFADPLAVRILGAEAEPRLREMERDPSRRGMRLFIVVRSRFAEAELTAAVERGVGQLVVLGAGLDTYAYRHPYGDRLRVFEVDHPATQAWKRQLLADAGIALPGSLTFVPVDFERQTLADALPAAGLDTTRPSFFSWLGVVPYLTEAAVWSTLRYVASLPAATQVVFDYSNPPDRLTPETRAAHEQRAAHVAALGESFCCYFETPALHDGLKAIGFDIIQDRGPREIIVRYFPERAVSAAEHGGHILSAAKT
jgi:methyltransferase (TIGR00027 family)